MAQDVHGRLPACATIAPVNFLLMVACVRKTASSGVADRLPTMGAYSTPLSRWSMKRMRGSGSEPRYLPVVENTSCWGLVLYFFCASAPEAVPTISTRAMAVLVNMVVSYRRVAHTLLVCASIYCA